MSFAKLVTIKYLSLSKEKGDLVRSFFFEHGLLSETHWIEILNHYRQPHEIPESSRKAWAWNATCRCRFPQHIRIRKQRIGPFSNTNISGKLASWTSLILLWASLSNVSIPSSTCKRSFRCDASVNKDPLMNCVIPNKKLQFVLL